MLRCNVPINTVWSENSLRIKAILFKATFNWQPIFAHANFHSMQTPNLRPKLNIHHDTEKPQLQKKRILDYQYCWCHFLTKTYFWLLDWSLTEAKWPNISSFAHSWTLQTSVQLSPSINSLKPSILALSLRKVSINTFTLYSGKFRGKSP